MLLLRFIIVSLVVVSLGSLGCAKRESAEEQIRKVLDEGAAALEARDAARAAETLDEAYKDERGRDKKKLKGLTFFALQQGPVLVSMQNIVVDVKGDTAADVSMKVLAVQGSAELKTAKDLLPTNANTFDLKIKMLKSDGAWKVGSISGIGGPGFD